MYLADCTGTLIPRCVGNRESPCLDGL